MNKLLLSLLFSLFACTILVAQNPVGVCAQVESEGQDVLVNINVNDFADLLSFQFGVAWEANKYEFIEIININEKVEDTSGFIATDGVPSEISVLRTLWFDDTVINPATLDDGALLFTVKLRRLNEGQDGPIGIAPNEDFFIEFANSNTEIVDYIIDADGCSTLAFSTLSSNENIILNSLEVSPNPFQDEISIQLESVGSGSFSIYSISGKFIEKYNYSQTDLVTLPLESIRAGSYVLMHETEDGKMLGQSKIIKL